MDSSASEAASSKLQAQSVFDAATVAEKAQKNWQPLRQLIRKTAAIQLKRSIDCQIKSAKPG